MFPFPADPLQLFDKPLIIHHEASLPFPPPKLDASSPLFPLSPLIFDYEIFNDITLPAPPPQISPPSPPPPATSPPDNPSTHKSTEPSPPTKAFCGLDKCGTAFVRRVVGGGGSAGGRRLRKDRHSKIYTAQGPRDRRMRLSLDVARKFFDLQDTLGFDKASKTVDWLLTSCKTSILELTGSAYPPAHPAVDAGGNAKSESSTSECEVISTSTTQSPGAARAKRAALRRSRIAPAHPPPSRESRLMARARARERTREKKMQRGEFEEEGQRKQLASSSSPFEAAGEESATHTTKSSMELMIAEEGQPSSCSPDHYKKSSGASSRVVITSAAGPISIFDYSENIVHKGDAISFVEEHWDIQPPGNAEEQRALLADAQLHPWLWEAFNRCI